MAYRGWLGFNWGFGVIEWMNWWMMGEGAQVIGAGN